MGASKQVIIEKMEREDIREWLYESMRSDEGVDAAVEKLFDESVKNQQAFFEKQNLAQTLLMVTHVIRSFGFCNPDVQVARLDPDNIGDGSKILTEAFSVVEIPVLGRNVSFMVENALRGKYDELAQRLGWEKGEGAEKSGK
jgi:hypothetical protein